MQHLASYSGGLGSWMSAKRMVAEHGLENSHFMFADTIIEADDLYRFILESLSEIYGTLTLLPDFKLPDLIDDLPGRKAKLAEIRHIAMEHFPRFHWLCDGRTPWEVFKDERYIGNSRKDPCSKILKRQLMASWRKTHFNPDNVITYYGIDWTESHRLDRLRLASPIWKAEAPLCLPPLLNKQQLHKMAEDAGLRPVGLYALGYPHANCFGWCVKAGQAWFALLLRTNPRLYRYHEEQEQTMMTYLGHPYTIMKDRRGGQNKPMSMRQFRERLEANPSEYDKFEWGGCGCAME